MYKKLIVLFLCAALLYPAPIPLAGPKGGKVVGGNANISQSGSTTTINQTSNRAIINWNSFDINKNESVRHNMPSSNSAGLHRVVGGGGASQIAGSLQSNGNVYIVNPAGIVIHNGAKIDVNGFVATSRDITDQNFMKGNMVFDKPGLPNAAIINKGNITLKDNGLAVLVAPTVRNDGIIAGKLGKVALGGSEAAWKLDMTGDDLIAFTLDEKAVNTLHAADGTPLASVENNGQIKAEGGVVVMSAAQLDGFVGSVVNNGEISAASVESKGGKIIFRGQGDSVDLVNNGRLDVSSQKADGGIVRMAGQAQVVNADRIDATGTKGGKVVLTGRDITLKTNSVIEASGTNGGGTVLVGGNAKGKGPEPNAKSVTVQKDSEILASATLKGDGGQVVVWADEKTQFDGRISAQGGAKGGDGGFVETSAKLLIIGDPAIVNTSSKKGKSGTWLMDPEDFVIAAANGDVSGATISKNLEFNDVVIEVVGDGDGEGNGNIIIKDEIRWDSDSILTLNAYRNLDIYSSIIVYGDNAGLIITTDKGELNIGNSKITMSGCNPYIEINHDIYVPINSVDGLININDNIQSIQYIVLVNDIDLKGILFSPIGYDSSSEENHSQFKGIFEGFGNSIINMTQYGAGGLFYDISGAIRNVHIKDASIEIPPNTDPTTISIYDTIGILTPHVSRYNVVTDEYEDYGSLVQNVHVEGVISSKSFVFDIGGLVGMNYGSIYNSSSRVWIRLNGTAHAIGGLIGENFGGNISSSYSQAYIFTSNYGEVGPFNYIGGFVGNNTHRYRDPEIINSYSRGNIYLYYDGDMPFIGGFVGRNQGIIKNCYSSTNINDPNAGGFAGYITEGGSHIFKSEIISCYWDKTSTTLEKAFIESEITDESSLQILGLTRQEMYTKSSFKGWNFDDIWEIEEGKSYPELREIANNQINIPDEPVEPTPPDNPIDPDPVNPDPIDPEPVDPTPVDPDPVDPSPVDPTPTEPDPVQPEPERPTPSKPDPVTPIEPDPIDPTNPVQPSNPQPSQPTPTEPEPIRPTPSQPEPTNPAPVTPPSVEPTQPTPPQPNVPAPTNPTSPIPTAPGVPQQPSSGNGGVSSGPSNSGIRYQKIDGVLHVFQDNKYIGVLGEKSDKNELIIVGEDPVEIEDGKTYRTEDGLQVTERPITDDRDAKEDTSVIQPNFVSSGHKVDPVSYTTFQREMEQFLRDEMGRIGKDFLDSLAQEKKANDQALQAIKSNIRSVPPAPNAAYEAFAKFIYDAQEASDVQKFSNNLNDMFKQIIHSIAGGNKSINTSFTVDGVEYTIDGLSSGIFSKGFSFAKVNWTNPDTGRQESSTLYFASTPEETLKTLNNYQTALKDMMTEEMREVIAYFAEDLTGISHKQARDCVDVGEKIFNAMIDPKKGKELGKEIGNKVASQIKDGFFGWGAKRFDDFVVKNTANGGHIKELVDTVKNVQDAFNKVKDTYSQVAGTIDKAKGEYQQLQKLGDSAKEAQNNKNLLQALSTCDDFNKYSSSHFSKIYQYLTQDI